MLPTLDPASVRRELESAAGGLPVLLWCLGVIGMLWADVSWTERFHGLGIIATFLRKMRNLRFAVRSKGEDDHTLDMADTIPASELHAGFFGRYRMLAQREAVAVSSHGSITGYFVAPDEYEEFQRFKQRRRSFATAELPDEKAQAIGASRMDRRHARLDEMVDPK